MYTCPTANTFTELIELYTYREGYHRELKFLCGKTLRLTVTYQYFIRRKELGIMSVNDGDCDFKANASRDKLVQYRKTRLCKMDQFSEIMSWYLKQKSRSDFTFLLYRNVCLPSVKIR